MAGATTTRAGRRPGSRQQHRGAPSRVRPVIIQTAKGSGMSHPIGGSAPTTTTPTTSTQSTGSAGIHRGELPAGEEPTVGRLVAEASSHLSTLVRAEIALAKSELRFSAKAAGVGAALLAVAAFLLVLAVVMVSISAAYALAYVMPTWLAFLVVFTVYAVIAAVLALLGMKRLKKVSAPERTIETTKDTVSTLRHR